MNDMNVNHPYTKEDIAIIFDMIDFLGLGKHKYDSVELKTQVVLEIYMTISHEWSRLRRSGEYIGVTLSGLYRSKFAIGVSEKILNKYNIPTA